jgi:CIC family chloride channel protein
MSIKLKYLIETDFVVLHPNDTPKSRSNDIVHTHRNVFPVVDNEGCLIGLLFSDQLLEYLVSPDEKDHERLIKDIAQPPQRVIKVNTRMRDVMQIMDSQDLRILPVVDMNDKYLGFVTKNSIFNKYRAMLIRQGDYLQ